MRSQALARRLSVVAELSLLALAALGPAARAASARQTARVEGVFVMRGRVTGAGGIPGERLGQRVTRVWSFFAGCLRGPCQRVMLVRQRGRVTETLELRSAAPGRFSGRGGFHGPLLCRGRRFRYGEHVSFVLSVRITHAVRVDGVALATAVSASYRAVRVTNRTRCVAAFSGDAAVYAGRRSGPLPQPPTAAFTFSPSTGAITTLAFRDASVPGTGGARIVWWHWGFADPLAGAADMSGEQNPGHTFVAPGAHDVRLSVIDGNGLEASVEHVVTIASARPADVRRAVRFAPTPAPG